MTSAAPGINNFEAYTVLIVDDNKAHVRLLREAFRDRSKAAHNICSVQDGINALDYLRRQGQYAQVSLPDLILLDLNLPRKNGQEVLKEVKEDPELKVIPVVVLSNSRRQEDINISYSLHANCYIPKPSNLRDLFEVVQQIDNFWLDTVSLVTS